MSRFFFKTSKFLLIGAGYNYKDEEWKSFLSRSIKNFTRMNSFVVIKDYCIGATLGCDLEHVLQESDGKFEPNFDEIIQKLQSLSPEGVNYKERCELLIVPWMSEEDARWSPIFVSELVKEMKIKQEDDLTSRWMKPLLKQEEQQQQKGWKEYLLSFFN